MWAWNLSMVALIFFYMLIESEATWCTCRYCYHCTGCSATACSRVGRSLSLLDYLAAYGQEIERQLAVAPPVIPCTVPGALCNYPHNKYCCALQSDGTKTCGLGEGWSTCVSGSTLINNIITPIYTKSLCDFDFSCTGNGGNDCCGGLNLYSGEGPGTCSTAYCTSTPLVACNYIGNAATQYKTPSFDSSVTVNGIMPTQVNNQYCGENNVSNRNNGRCRASNLCCSPLGLCDVDTASCATKSISWVFMGGFINDWVQTGGAADSSIPIPCGNGTIGNGRCETNDNTYGVNCCSDTGFCSSSFCNGADGNVYTCNCAHGTAGSGTRGCQTCASCKEGYYLSSATANTCSPIKLGNFNCPSGAVVTSIDLWYDSGSKSITGIDFFKCSDGSTKSVYKGQSTGIHRSSTEPSGYCGGKVGYVYLPLGTKNQLTTELTVASCDGAASTSFGGPVLNYPQNGAITYNFQSGYFLTGLKAATCQNGIVNNVCFLTFTFTTVQFVPTATPITVTPTAPTKTVKPTVAPTAVPSATLVPTTSPTIASSTVSCAAGKFITQINVSSKEFVYGISSITCSDSVVLQVSTGLLGPPNIAISGDGSGVSPGYCSYKSGLSSSFVTQLKFIECTGVSDGAYGTASATTTTVKCPTGQKATAIKFTAGISLASFAFVCGTITSKVSCASGFYITQIALRASDVVYGISSITCSNGSLKQISTGLTGGSSITALSGDGSSSSGGYCAYGSGLSGSFVTQLSFTECTTSVNDGPFGSNAATVTPVSVPCSSGKRATGITTISGTAVTSFAFVCSTIATAAPTPSPTVQPQSPTKKPTAAPTAIATTVAAGPTSCCANGTPIAGTCSCSTCNSGFGLSSVSDTCVAVTDFSCNSGNFLTKITLRAGDWVYGISSITCSDGQVIQVSAVTEGIQYTAVAGDGSNTSPGYCSRTYGTYNGAMSLLTFNECSGGGTDGPYGVKTSTALFSKGCPVGYMSVGIQINTWTPGAYLTRFSNACGIITTAPTPSPTVQPQSPTKQPTAAPTAIVTTAAPTICCANGTATAGTCTCASCDSGFGLSVSNTCVGVTLFQCNTGQFVTRITLRAGDWVYGISSITCSDNQVIQVSSVTGGTEYTAVAGDGSSTSPGYCTRFYGSNNGAISQLSFNECSATTIVATDGPYGATSSTTIQTAGCTAASIGYMAVGIYVNTWTPGAYLTRFSYYCGSITVNYNCPSNTFVTYVNLWYDTVSALVTELGGIHCSDGSAIDIFKGQSIGADFYYPNDTGFCSGKVSYVHSPGGAPNLLTTELTLHDCGSTLYSLGTQRPAPDGGADNYAFQTGKKLTGMSAASCPNGSGNLCFLSLTFTTIT